LFARLKRRAEGVATELVASRRGFLGRVGRGALVAAGTLGALLAAPGPARARTHENFKKCMKACCQNSYCDTADGYSTCYFLCTMPQ
jgi:hypothetical protein